MSKNFTFKVNLYGNVESLSQTLSKARVRIFYRGLNRNYTYITDEFAEKLLSTLSYTPIIGKYESGDFSDHGKVDEQLQVYGVVPENPNFQWETHLDGDGIEREYACADVILWTARFKEAKEIFSKSQSMELYDKSIKGQWVYQDGKKFFKFTDGAFLGLCALGDNTEPCFEGAAFYSYSKSLQELIEEINKYNLNGGKEEMVLQFKMSDREKYDAIFSLINPNLHEGYIEAGICDVYDNYALCVNYENREYFRAYYTKDENDVVEISKTEKAFILDVTEEQYQVLKRLEELSGNNFSLIEEKVTLYEELVANAAQVIEEPIVEDPITEDPIIEDPITEEPVVEEPVVEDPITEEPIIEEPVVVEPVKQSEDVIDYTQKITELMNQISELQNENSTLQREQQNLSTALEAYQLQEKKEVLNKYSKLVGEEVISEYKDNLDKYSVDELNKELAVKAIDTNSTQLFNKQSQEILPDMEYSSNTKYSGADKILAQYLNKK